MAGRIKHMERSRRSHRDKVYNRSQGLSRIATVSQKKQSVFRKIKEGIMHRKQLHSSKGEA